CLPSVLMHTSRILSPSWAVRKIFSPQTAGVDDPLPGKASFQATFLSALHSVGRFLAFAMPLLSCPRHCGQTASARGCGSTSAASVRETVARRKQPTNRQRQAGEVTAGSPDAKRGRDGSLICYMTGHHE